MRRIGLLVLALVAAGLIVAWLRLPVLSCVVNFLGCVERAGMWGPVVLGLFYVVFSVLLVPASIPTLTAGFLFGVGIGSATAIIGSTAGACVAFLVGRTLARRWVARRVAHSRRFAALDTAIGEHGFKIVLLTRLSPISPFVVLNYMFGLTKVSFWEYAAGSLIGMIPGTVLFVYFGAGLRSLAEVRAFSRGQGPGGETERVIFWIGLAVTVVIVVVLAKLARNTLRQAMPASKQTVLDQPTGERDDRA
jgi:uncharacterized membrane protein YdjX (TVP38/TMEM64 family)